MSRMETDRKSMLPDNGETHCVCGDWPRWSGKHLSSCPSWKPNVTEVAPDAERREIHRKMRAALPRDVREATLGSDKESRSVVDERNAAKPDTGSSGDRQHENPCLEPPTCGIAGCVGKHHPQDHNAIIDARTCAACHEPAKGYATIDGERYCHDGEGPTCYEKASWFGDDASRSLFHSLQDAIRERDALRAKVDGLQAHLDSIPYESEVELVRVIRDLRAEVERVKAERNTIHDWYVDAKTENVSLRAEVEHMRPVVEAACDYMSTVERFDASGVHRTGRGSRARIRQAVDAYRKDTNDE